MTTFASSKLTLAVGTHPCKLALRQAVQSQGFLVNRWADRLVCSDDFAVEVQPRQVELEIRSLRSLGFEQFGRVRDLIRAVRALGRYQPCPVETSLQLRMQLTYHREGTWLTVLSVPIWDPIVGCPTLLSLGHEDGQLLVGASRANLDHVVVDDCLVLCLRA